jgi:hypothetical protein
MGQFCQGFRTHPKLSVDNGQAASVADVRYAHSIVLDREKNSVYVRFVSVKQLPNLEGEYIVFTRGFTPQRRIRQGRDGLSQTSKPAQAGFAGLFFQELLRIASKSRLAFREVLAWKAMLHAQFFKHFVGRLGAPGFHILVAFPDAFYGADRLRVSGTPSRSGS